MTAVGTTPSGAVVVDETFRWIDERGILENGLGSRSYERATAAMAEQPFRH